MFENIKFILMDVEGTTTSLSFVKNVLFTYSEIKIIDFVKKIAENELPKINFKAKFGNIKDVLTPQQAKRYSDTNKGFFKKEDFDNLTMILNNIKEDISNQSFINIAGVNLNNVYELLLNCIQNDIKYAPLKELQGYLWKYGYIKGDFKGHVYEDVPLAFKNWTDKGIKLGIYSSGSVLAQKLLFSYSEYGNLTTYIKEYFDLTTGVKKEKTSYEKIANYLNIEPNEILFLSDCSEELKSAREASFQVCQILRHNVKEQHKYPTEKDFLELKLGS